MTAPRIVSNYRQAWNAWKKFRALTNESDNSFGKYLGMDPGSRQAEASEARSQRLRAEAEEWALPLREWLRDMANIEEDDEKKRRPSDGCRIR